MKTLVIESVLYMTISAVAFMLFLTLLHVLKRRIKDNNLFGVLRFYILGTKRHLFHLATLGLNIAVLAYWMHIEAASVLWMLLLIVSVPISAFLLTWAARITALILCSVIKACRIVYAIGKDAVLSYLDIFRKGWF